MGGEEREGEREGAAQQTVHVICVCCPFLLFFFLHTHTHTHTHTCTLRALDNLDNGTGTADTWIGRTGRGVAAALVTSSLSFSRLLSLPLSFSLSLSSL